MTIEDEGGEVIFRYTNEQAIEDGIKVQIGPRVFATTNCMRAMYAANELTNWPDEAPEKHDPRNQAVWQQVSRVLHDYNAGHYCDEGASEYPEECERGFACYLCFGVRVWAIEDGEGLHLILPSDH